MGWLILLDLEIIRFIFICKSNINLLGDSSPQIKEILNNDDRELLIFALTDVNN